MVCLPNNFRQVLHPQLLCLHKHLLSQRAEPWFKQLLFRRLNLDLRGTHLRSRQFFTGFDSVPRHSGDGSYHGQHHWTRTTSCLLHRHNHVHHLFCLGGYFQILERLLPSVHAKPQLRPFRLCTRISRNLHGSRLLSSRHGCRL